MLHVPLRSAIRVAHRALLVYWRVRRPKTHGAVIAMWCRGKILVLETTYRPGASLPGGGVRPGESPARAAARELEEELGVALDGAHLTHAHRGQMTFEHRDDTVDIFAIELDERPVLRPNRYEIEWARWKDPEEVLAMPDVMPHLRDYLERELERRS